MKCPTCTDDRLVMTERSGIEIDYCPACRGVWLDRGELDKIIERSLAGSPTVPPPVPGPTRLDDRDVRQPVQSARDDDRYDRDRFDDDRFDDDRDGGGRRPKKRRESLFSELFDF